jgi:hypothetical protein
MKIGFKKLALTTALTTALVALTAPMAAAQSADNPFLRGRYVAVADRPQPEFDPQVIHAGAFDVSSSLGLSAEYNDNIFAASNNEQNDTIIRVQPSVDVHSNWSVHQLNAGVSVDYNKYLDFDSETVTNYNGYVGGRLDVQRDFQLNGRINAGHATEPRYDPAGANASAPIGQDIQGASIGAAFRRDRMRLDGAVGATKSDFDTQFNYRDSTDTYVFGRGSYAVSPDVAVFIQARSTEQNFKTALPNRDATLSSVQVGTSFELTAPFRGEIAVGSNKQNHKDPTQRDLDGLSIDGNLQWFPTQLTTLTFHANRGVSDPGIVQVTSATTSSYGVRIDHELFRNVLLYGDLAYGKYEFSGTGYDRTDEYTDLALGLAYKLNRNARFEFGYRNHNQTSSGLNADRDLNQNVISAGIRIYP